MNIKYIIASLLRKHGKHRFVYNLKINSKLLDIGCGNASVIGLKRMCPSCVYVGIDIAGYRQTEYSKSLMDEYIITPPGSFAQAIEQLGKDFDAVVSSHNIEHCAEPERVLSAMMGRLKVGGLMYLSFPTTKSVSFPPRLGTLNFYDDPTHTKKPPDYEAILKYLEQNGFIISYRTKQYRPFLLFITGAILEGISRRKGKIFPGTWEYYGFESIVHCKRVK